jgi:hypothetical protein
MIRIRIFRVVIVVIISLITLTINAPGMADSGPFEYGCTGDNRPVGRLAQGDQKTGASRAIMLARQPETGKPTDPVASSRILNQDSISEKTETVKLPKSDRPDLLEVDPLELIKVTNISPLYRSPRLKNEGVWTCAVSPRDENNRPVIFRTVYRPSVEFPNAVAHMMIMDMRSLTMKYYVGSQEPGAKAAFSSVTPKEKNRLVAITNAMWMQRHSRGAGAIFRGKQIYPMVPGMATLIIYKDGSVDIREWSKDIPVQLVRDARQLRHLLVKNGKVIKNILKDGRLEDSEIGLGFLLANGGRNRDGKHKWFVAHRSAFGIRPDGSLVFVVGHHVSSKDMAKALVLAGSVRGMHGDANPHNIVGNIYLRDSNGHFIKKLGLSPEQTKYSLKRYDNGYTKDFFGYFLKTRQDKRTRFSKIEK